MSGSHLHPSTSGFATSAEAYERGRPGYPDGAVQLIAEACDIRSGNVVLDLGAGTGKLTGALAATGATVVAMEPIAAMSRSARVNVPRAKIVEATAEAIPLRAGSVRAVTAAQAFHWFRVTEAATQIHRVLAKDGRLALIWNVRDQTDRLQARLSEIIEPFRGATPSERDRDWEAPLAATGLFEREGFDSFHWVQRLDGEGLVDRVTSISYIAALAPETRAEVVAKIRAIDPGAERSELPYRTDVYLFRRR